MSLQYHLHARILLCAYCSMTRYRVLLYIFTIYLCINFTGLFISKFFDQYDPLNFVNEIYMKKYLSELSCFIFHLSFNLAIKFAENNQNLQYIFII